MYNHQLDTFMKVAELGSFSKAAEVQYITPGAVQQQIKSLELNLGTKLFQRTQRGTKLTPAGKLLFAETPKLIAMSNEIREQITELTQGEKFEIRVGSSPVEHGHLYSKWWTLYTTDKANYHAKFWPISSIGNQKEWDEIDIMEGAYVGNLTTEKFDFLALTTVPIAHAVWKDHPLANKKILRYEDMQGQTLITLGGSHLIEQIRGLPKLARKHGINVITKEYYDASTFSMCITNGYIIQIPLCEQYSQPDLVTIPCDWDYTVPYGLYYRKDASPVVKDFIRFIQESN